MKTPWICAALTAALLAAWSCGDPAPAPPADTSSAVAEKNTPAPKPPTAPPAAAEKPQPPAKQAPPPPRKLEVQTRPTAPPETVYVTQVDPKTDLSPAAISLYQLLKANGDSTTSYRKLVKAFPATRADVDLGKLAAHLSRHGLEAKVRSEPLADFLAAGKPGVLACSEDRKKFLVFLGREGEKLRILDPLEGVRAVQKDEVSDRYCGANLRLEREVARPAGGAADFVCEELVRTFGRLTAGRSFTCNIRVRNAGTAPLKIGWIHSKKRCCARVARLGYTHDLSKPPKRGGGTRVLPGQSVWLVADIDTLHRGGVTTFTAPLTTNDPDEPEVHLFLVGNIVRVYHCEPPSLWFAQVPSSIGASMHMWVRHCEGKPFKITRLRTSVDSVRATIDPDAPRTRKPLNALEAKLMPQRTSHPEEDGWVGIKIELVPGTRVGSRSAKVQLECDGVPVEASVVASVIGNLQLMPPVFALGAVQQGAAHETKMRIVSPLGEGFKVERVKATPKCLKPELKPAGPGAYELTLRLEEGWTTHNLHGWVTIHSNDPLEPEKKVKVFGLVRR